MKHLLTSFLLLSCCSSIFAQSSPPSGYTWIENPSNGHFYTFTDLRTIQNHINETGVLGRSTNLATVRSQAEQDWIEAAFGLAQGDLFLIGLTDDDTYSIEGTFVWMSGETVVFTDWHSGEPNNSLGGEDFVTANQTLGSTSAGWNDGHLIGTTDTEKGVYEFIPGAPQTITVDDTGAGDFLDIQSAINFADNGDTVIVKDGTYFGHINFNGKAITLKSENGPVTTIVDGSLNAGTSIVTFNNGEGSSSVIDGFTVQNGYSNDGGGIYCEDSSPSIINCEITDNIAAYNGGGVYCIGLSSPTIDNCTFENNKTNIASGGGLHCYSDASPIISNCTFLGNDSALNGGGLFCEKASPLLYNCTFTLNVSGSNGAGLYLWTDSDLTVTNCRFTNNTAGTTGGGISSDDSSPILYNCTFTENIASYGGAIYIHDNNGNDSTVEINSSILWGNTAANGADIYHNTGLDPIVNYSDVGGGWVGINNIDVDPLFIDPMNNDLRLEHSSLCIDAGDPSIAPYGSTRVDGLPDLGIIDIGFRRMDTPIDSDLDGVGDDAEITLGTDPLDQDTDDDGLSDGEEVLTFSTDPLNVDTDLDGLQDGTEVGNDAWWLGDPSNGIDGTDTSINIPDADPSTTTNPLDDDTDNDGLMDGQEDVNHDGQFLGIELDPNDFDCDNDGLGDGLELGLAVPNGNNTDMTVFVADADPSTTTRATHRDTDGGGIHDGIEDANRNGMIDAGEIDPRDASDDSVYMKISPMVEGSSVTFNYYGCEPYSWMHLCYSLAGPGPTSFTNITLDLSPPIGSRPPLQINSNGTAQLGPLPIPPNIIVGDQLWFQGVQVSLFGSASYFTTTNMIPVTVQ